MILRRVLVANRGEIAVRVLRTCQRLGIETVLAVSDADTDSVPARLAGHTIRIGPASAAGSYLNVEAVVAAAVAARADAIHPGYGFLSENPRLARACEAAGVVFIGPGADVLEAAGDKLAARNHAVAAGLPVLPGGLVGAAGDGAGGAARRADTADAARLAHAADAARLAHAADAARLAERIGYPVLVKAAGGGGGRGLRVVRDPGRLAEAVAEGRGLRLAQADVCLRGHAIECRINAEDPAAGFRPSPGAVTSAVFPAGPGIRVDTHIQPGSAVPPQYDSLLAKLIVRGGTRAQALARLRGALARCEIGGVASTVAMHAALAADAEFAAGGVATDFLAGWLGRETRSVRDKKDG